jgi:AAA family ATP:ADP antiporter
VVGAGSAVAALQVMPVTKLLLGSTAAFLVTAVVLTTLESDAGETTGVVTTVDDQVPGFFRELRARPYLGRLVVLVGLSTGAVLVADYLFKSVVAKSMPAADLGAFFAVAYAVMNTIALVVQLFLSQYLVRRLGVIAAFGILPSFLLLGGAATLLTNGAIWATLLIKGADGSLRHSLHRIATELLWMPLPEDVRTRVKTFVDTVLVRGVQAVTAALLLVLAMVGADGPVPLAVLILVLASSWVFLTIQLRRPYLDLFRTALQRPTATGAGLLRLDLESVEVVVEALSSRDPARALAAIELLVHSKRTRLIPALILYHEAESVLLRALEVIGTKERKEWVPLAQRLLQHPSDAVRVAAVRSLAGLGTAPIWRGASTTSAPACVVMPPFGSPNGPAVHPTNTRRCRSCSAWAATPEEPRSFLCWRRCRGTATPVGPTCCSSFASGTIPSSSRRAPKRCSAAETSGFCR